MRVYGWVYMCFVKVNIDKNENFTFTDGKVERDGFLIKNVLNSLRDQAH